MAAGFLLVPACQPNLPLLEQVQQAGELIVATQMGAVAKVQSLLATGVNPEYVDKRGKTAEAYAKEKEDDWNCRRE